MGFGLLQIAIGGQLLIASGGWGRAGAAQCRWPMCWCKCALREARVAGWELGQMCLPWPCCSAGQLHPPHPAFGAQSGENRAAGASLSPSCSASVPLLIFICSFQRPYCILSAFVCFSFQGTPCVLHVCPACHHFHLQVLSHLGRCCTVHGLPSCLEPPLQM